MKGLTRYGWLQSADALADSDLGYLINHSDWIARFCHGERKHLSIIVAIEIKLKSSFSTAVAYRCRVCDGQQYLT